MVDFIELKNKLTTSSKNDPNRGLTLEEAKELLELSGADIIDLLALANRVRELNLGDHVGLCSIVNAKSGNCSEDCAFCSQSRHHKTKIDEFPLRTTQEILAVALDAEKNGAKDFSIVTSGRKLSQDDFNNVVKAVDVISKSTSLKVCASLGILTSKQLVKLKVAGLSKYHHNLETSESFFSHICKTHEYSERYDMVKRATAAGLEVCSGGIIGLGESPEQRLELADALRNLNVDSVPINILIPIPGTPLSDQSPLEPIEILKTIAIFRLMLPNKNIKLAGGREYNLGALQAMILTSGANGLLIGNYLTMPGQSPEADLKMIKSLGLTTDGHDQKNAENIR